MVRSLNGLGYELLEMYRANNRVSDSLDIRLLKTWIQQTRAQLIKQRLDANPFSIDEHIAQNLGVVQFAPVDSSVSNVNLSSKYYMRSINPIPATIYTKSNIPTFTRIASIDRLERKFNLVPYERLLVSGNGKFNSDDIYVALLGNYLILNSKSNLHKYISNVHVRGVFANPIDAYEFQYGVGTWSDDNEYPVSEAIVADMINMIVDKKFRLVLNQIEDKVSNGEDDTTNITPRK